MFYERFSTLCSERNLTVTTVLKELGLSPSKGTQWKSGTMPSSKNLTKIANYFDVSIDYLLGNDDIKKRPTLENAERNDELELLINEILNLPPSQMEKVRDYVDFLKSAHKTAKDE